MVLVERMQETVVIFWHTIFVVPIHCRCAHPLYIYVSVDSSLVQVLQIQSIFNWLYGYVTKSLSVIELEMSHTLVKMVTFQVHVEGLRCNFIYLHCQLTVVRARECCFGYKLCNVYVIFLLLGCLINCIILVVRLCTVMRL